VKQIVGCIEGSVVIEGETARCQVRFSSEERVFAGHFPNDPIVPGVLMLDGLAKLAAKLHGGAADVESIKEAKFRAIVRPNESLIYTVTRTESGYAGSVKQEAGEPVLSTRFSLTALEGQEISGIPTP
jgi:3-hydroxymyristoyl/3-hydroxydecanoyl-(acyl carrier protein) dehydratase